MIESGFIVFFFCIFTEAIFKCASWVSVCDGRQSKKYILTPFLHKLYINIQNFTFSAISSSKIPSPFYIYE